MVVEAYDRAWQSNQGEAMNTHEPARDVRQTAKKLPATAPARAGVTPARGPVPRRDGPPPLDDSLGRVLARAVAARAPLLQRAHVRRTDFTRAHVAQGQNTVSGLRGDEEYRFGGYVYMVHFHGNHYDFERESLTSFTGTFEGGGYRMHITLTEVDDLVWLPSYDRACDGWNYVQDAEDATYRRLASLIGVRSDQIKRRRPQKVGAYVPPHLRH